MREMSPLRRLSKILKAICRSATKLYPFLSVMHEGVDSMPIISVNGAALYYEEHGTGPEIIVFAHGLLWSCRMSHAQVALLTARYPCVPFHSRAQRQHAA